MNGLWNRFTLGATVGLCRLLRPLGPPRPLDPNQDWQRIVLVQNTGLGDTMLSTPAIRAVRRSFPQAHLALIGHQRHQSLLAANPAIDQLLIYRGKAKSFRPLVRALRKGRFEVGVVLHGNDPETIPLLWAGKMDHIVADAKTRLDFLLSRRLPALAPDEHMIDHRLALVQAIGARPQGRRLEQPLPPESQRRAEEIIGRRLPGPGPLAALAPGGSSTYKRWPADRFAQAAGLLQSRYGARILILTSASEAPLAGEISANLAGPCWATNGQAPLIEAAALLAQSSLLLANDSGLYHLGLAVKTPTLVIMGAEGPANYGPVGSPRAEAVFVRPQVCTEKICRRKDCTDPACLNAISTEMVISRLEESFADCLKG